MKTIWSTAYHLENKEYIIFPLDDLVSAVMKNFDFVILCASGHPLFVYDKMCVSMEKVLLDEKRPGKIFKEKNVQNVFKVLCAVHFDIYYK